MAILKPEFRAVVMVCPDEHYARLIVQSLQERFPHLGFLWEVVDIDPTVFCTDPAFGIVGVKVRVEAFAQGVLQGINHQIASEEDGPSDESKRWWYCLSCGKVEHTPDDEDRPALDDGDEYCSHQWEQMTHADLERYQAGRGYPGD